MEIRRIYALNGPNYWSISRHKLILMVLDLEDMEDLPSNKIENFKERLEKLLPSLYEHTCSIGTPGGFFQRVEEGTWMGHVIEHIALEIQTLAGMFVGFGRTRSYGEKGVYNIVFSYVEEEVGRFAAKAGVRICEALIKGEEYDLASDIQEMREIRQEVRLGPSTASIIEEAEKRGIPWIRLNKYSLCQLGYGENQKRIQATITSETSNLAVELACNKEFTKNLLEQAEIPVPKGRILGKESELEAVVSKMNFPLVTKPLNGNHGRGITINIKCMEEALNGFRAAKKVSNSVIIEEQVKGNDYRVLVINNKLVAAAKRSPAQVTGDGESTVQQLIDEINKDPRRGLGHE